MAKDSALLLLCSFRVVCISWFKKIVPPKPPSTQLTFALLDPITEQSVVRRPLSVLRFRLAPCALGPFGLVIKHECNFDGSGDLEPDHSARCRRPARRGGPGVA